MKKGLLLVLLAVAGVATWYFFVTRPKPKTERSKAAPIAVSRYPAAFTATVDTFLNVYYGLSETLVNWDSTTVTAAATNMEQTFSAIQWNVLNTDTLIAQTTASYRDAITPAIVQLKNGKTLTEKRLAFNAISQNLYDLLRTIKYDGAKIYLQQCPMAFNDTEEGLWLSKTKKIRNPYLGLHHPKYSGAMLSCGDNKDTLQF